MTNKTKQNKNKEKKHVEELRFNKMQFHDLETSEVKYFYYNIEEKTFVMFINYNHNKIILF